MQVPALIKKTLNNRLDILYTRIVILKAVCRFLVLLLSTFFGFSMTLNSSSGSTFKSALKF